MATTRKTPDGAGMARGGQALEKKATRDGGTAGPPPV